MTKLMTAMVALDYSKDLNRKLVLKTRVGSRLPAKEFTRNELFHAMLIRSDNAAAETIADDYPNGRAAFIKAMNAKAKEMNLSSTEFKDPTGLSGSNLSSGTDMVDIVKAASNYELIRKTSIKKQTIIEAHYKTKIRSIVLENTNKPLLFQFDDIVISKTGFTNSAGWCVALLVEHWTKRAPQEPTAMNKFLSYFDGEPDRNIARGDLEQHVIIIMGAKNKSERIAEVQRIMYNHINDQQISQWDYDWKINENGKE
jgi:D-alanyl-D-alanine carboxypeptidase